jgi:Putative glutamine amidotransferase
MSSQRPADDRSLPGRRQLWDQPAAGRRHLRPRAVAFASDIGPHWAPGGFTGWEGYLELWDGIAAWAVGADR